MWLLLSERRDLLRKNRQFYKGRKCRTCVTRASFYACVKKKKKNSSSSSSRGYICRPSFDLMEIATDR